MKFNYENLCRSWKWEIPTYFNIGRDCTDRHAKSESHGNKIALYWESEEGEIKRFTFAELSSLTNQIGNALLSLGFQKGDRLLIRLPNLPEFPLVFLGAIKSEQFQFQVVPCLQPKSLITSSMTVNQKELSLHQNYTRL